MLGDRNFAARALITAIAGTSEELLIRTKSVRRLPVCRRLPDGSYLSRIGPVVVRVVRAEITILTPAGIEQEVYALLVTYQALRIAIADATLGPRHIDPDRASFSIVINTARDQLIAAANVIADTAIDLVGGQPDPGPTPAHRTALPLSPLQDRPA